MKEQIHQHVLFNPTRKIGQWFPAQNSPAYISTLHKTSSEVEFLQLQLIFLPLPSILINFKGSVSQHFHFDPSLLL